MPKNYRKIPDSIRAKIAGIAIDDVVVASVKRLQLADVAAYAHLGLREENGILVVPAPSVPPANRGKYSNTNVNGDEIVRKDLPKIHKTFSIESPNWGDSNNGTHTVDFTREVWQRELIPPKGLTISVELLQAAADGSLVIKFAVDQVLSKRSEDFEIDLLYNLNILQENVGAVNLFASTASLADFTASIHLDWEILPAGDLDEVVRRMLQGKRAVPAEQVQVMRQRLEALRRLNPKAYIAGTSEFLRYFGASFEDDLVVFENLNYGNALYVMFEDWAELSRRSRIDLLKSRIGGFERIVHTEGWFTRLEGVIKRHREILRRRRPVP